MLQRWYVGDPETGVWLPLNEYVQTPGGHVKRHHGLRGGSEPASGLSMTDYHVNVLRALATVAVGEPVVTTRRGGAGGDVVKMELGEGHSRRARLRRNVVGDMHVAANHLADASREVDDPSIARVGAPDDHGAVVPQRTWLIPSRWMEFASVG